MVVKFRASAQREKMVGRRTLEQPTTVGGRPPPPRGLVVLHSRKGKGRAANGDRPICAAGCKQEQQIQGDMLHPPHPTHDMDCPHTGGVGRRTPSMRKRRHANYPASHVALPHTKMWCSESANARHHSVALHRRGYRANSNILPKYLIPECFFSERKKNKKRKIFKILPFGTQDFAKKG